MTPPRPLWTPLTVPQRSVMAQAGRTLVRCPGGNQHLTLSALTPYVTYQALERHGYVEIVDRDGPAYRVLLTDLGALRAREEYARWQRRVDRPTRM